MEGPLLVLATLALLSPGRGEEPQYCKGKHCPYYEDCPEHEQYPNVERRLYESTEWIKIRLPEHWTEDQNYHVKEANSRLKAYCKKLMQKNPASRVDCERWPLAISVEQGKIYLLWLISHEGTLDKADGEDAIEIVTNPPRCVYVLKYTGIPSMENGVAKHDELVKVLGDRLEDSKFESEDFFGLTYGLVMCLMKL